MQIELKFNLIVYLDINYVVEFQYWYLEYILQIFLSDLEDLINYNFLNIIDMLK